MNQDSATQRKILRIRISTPKKPNPIPHGVRIAKLLSERMEAILIRMIGTALEQGDCEICFVVNTQRELPRYNARTFASVVKGAEKIFGIRTLHGIEIREEEDDDCESCEDSHKLSPSEIRGCKYRKWVRKARDGCYENIRGSFEIRKMIPSRHSTLLLSTKMRYGDFLSIVDSLTGKVDPKGLTESLRCFKGDFFSGVCGYVRVRVALK